MNNDNLYDAFGDISSKHIEEARDYRPPRSPIWVKLLALFICIFLVVAARVLQRTDIDIWDVLRRPDSYKDLVAGFDTVISVTTTVRIDGVAYEYTSIDVTNAFKLRRFADKHIVTNDMGEKWYSVEGEPDLNHLIRKGKNGWCSLWVFSYYNELEVPQLPD